MTDDGEAKPLCIVVKQKRHEHGAGAREGEGKGDASTAPHRAVPPQVAPGMEVPGPAMELRGPPEL